MRLSSTLQFADPAIVLRSAAGQQLRLQLPERSTMRERRPMRARSGRRRYLLSRKTGVDREADDLGDGRDGKVGRAFEHCGWDQDGVAVDSSTQLATSSSSNPFSDEARGKDPGEARHQLGASGQTG